ncbi:hypothetical protein DTO96_101950 [Ephemeroptericola cinctiostellae]|uniref:Uncharacterized protein n=1 Tax=Ephemeroptericola cinctiostellae TaxID=2268024 RepID=A0A345DCW6_9BURK|nr:hypothetical protein DTO96_101950 [Ephemeroptericola cinctiostellae]
MEMVVTAAVVVSQQAAVRALLVKVLAARLKVYKELEGLTKELLQQLPQ